MFISELFRILRFLKLEPMKQLVALMMCAVSLGAAAQSTITYPYNPDGNADGSITTYDLQDLLSTYGLSFVPNELSFGDTTLSSVLVELIELISENSVHTADFSFEFDATLENDTILVQDLVGQDVAYVTAEVVHVDWYTDADQDVVLSMKSDSFSRTRNFGDLELRGDFNGESVVQRTPRSPISVSGKTIGKLSNSGSAPYFVVSPYSFNGTGGSGQITVRLSYRKS